MLNESRTKDSVDDIDDESSFNNESEESKQPKGSFGQNESFEEIKQENQKTFMINTMQKSFSDMEQRYLNESYQERGGSFKKKRRNVKGVQKDEHLRPAADFIEDDLMENTIFC